MNKRMIIRYSILALDSNNGGGEGKFKGKHWWSGGFSRNAIQLRTPRN